MSDVYLQAMTIIFNSETFRDILLESGEEKNVSCHQYQVLVS